MLAQSGVYHRSVTSGCSASIRFNSAFPVSETSTMNLRSFALLSAFDRPVENIEKRRQILLVVVKLAVASSNQIDQARPRHAVIQKLNVHRLNLAALFETREYPSRKYVHGEHLESTAPEYDNCPPKACCHPETARNSGVELDSSLEQLSKLSFPEAGSLVSGRWCKLFHWNC
jgi:hypothetical protein